MLENDQLNKKLVERGVLRNGCWELSLLFNQLPVGCFSWLGLFLTDGETTTVWSWFLSDRGWDILSVYKQMDPPHDLSGGGGGGQTTKPGVESHQGYYKLGEMIDLHARLSV